MTREDQIKKAEEIIAFGCSDELRDALIKDFPELAGAKDEDIRKAILTGMRQFKYGGSKTFALVSMDDCIDWLERQETVSTVKSRQYVQTLRGLIESYLETHKDYDKGYYDHIINWLQTNLIRITWEPEEELVQSLCTACRVLQGNDEISDASYDNICTLYHQLELLSNRKKWTE